MALHNASLVLVVKHNLGYITSHLSIKVLQQPPIASRHAQISLATHIRALLFGCLQT